MRVMTTVSLIALLGAGTIMGGCATRESVANAQATADLARTEAANARTTAERAQAGADGALLKASDAMTAAQAANAKIDTVTASLEKRKHYAKRHRRSNTAAAQPACPPQKAELRRYKKEAAARKAVHLAHSSDKNPQKQH